MLKLIALLLATSNFNPVPDMCVDSSYNITWDIDYNDTTYLFLYHKHSIFGDTLSTYENNKPVLNHTSKDSNLTWTVPHRMNSYNLNDDMFKFVLTNSPTLFSHTIDSISQYFFIVSNYFNINSSMKVHFPFTNVMKDKNYYFNLEGFENFTLGLEHMDTTWKPMHYNDYFCRFDECVFAIKFYTTHSLRLKFTDYPNITRFTKSFHVSLPTTTTNTMTSVTKTTETEVTKTTTLTTTTDTTTLTTTTDTITLITKTDTTLTTTTKTDTTLTTSPDIKDDIPLVTTMEPETTTTDAPNKKLFMVTFNTSNFTNDNNTNSTPVKDSDRNIGDMILSLFLILILCVVILACFFCKPTNKKSKSRPPSKKCSTKVSNSNKVDASTNTYPQRVTVKNTPNPMYDSGDSATSDEVFYPNDRVCVNAVYSTSYLDN